MSKKTKDPTNVIQTLKISNPQKSTKNSPTKEHISHQIFIIKKIKKQKKWSKLEDDLLLEKVKKYNAKNWKEISLNFKNKSAYQCFTRYNRIKPSINKGQFTKDEDIKIINLVNKYGQNWSKISKDLLTRNSKQIRNRYLNVLNPNLNREKFTFDNDLFIINSFNKYGPKWAKISILLNKGKTADQIKNHFHSFIEKNYSEFINKHDSSNNKNDIYNENNKLININRTDCNNDINININDISFNYRNTDNFDFINKNDINNNINNNINNIIYNKLNYDNYYDDNNFNNNN